MRSLRATAAALTLALALAALSGEARAEPPSADMVNVGAVMAPAAASFPEAVGVAAGAVLLDVAVMGMALLILSPHLRRRRAALRALLWPARPRG